MGALAFDPVIGNACAGALALVLLVGAWHKWADIDAFAFAVERYRLVPQRVARVLAVAFPLTESLAGAMLLVPGARGGAAGLAAALVALASFAIVANLLRGRTDIDCGCGGSGHPHRLSWTLVGRNAALLVGCVVAAAPAAPRDLVWLDAFTAAFAALALWIAYAAVDELLSDSGRFASASAGAASSARRSPLPGNQA